MISRVLPTHKQADPLSYSKTVSFPSILQGIFPGSLHAAGTDLPTSSQNHGHNPPWLLRQSSYCCTQLAVTVMRTLKLLQGTNLEHAFWLLTFVQQEKAQFLGNYTALLESDISLSYYCHTEDSIFFRETSRGSNLLLNYCHQLS